MASTATQFCILAVAGLKITGTLHNYVFTTFLSSVDTLFLHIINCVVFQLILCTLLEAISSLSIDVKLVRSIFFD